MQHHAHHVAGEAGVWVLVPYVLMAAVLCAYLTAALRQPVGRRRWSGWRTASFGVGIGLIAVALAPPVMEWGHRDFRGHMTQHLLIGMFAPLGLVLAAPATLALRALPTPAARVVVIVLRSRPLRWLAHPLPALLLNLGGMYLLYLTPLYRATLSNPYLHHAVHFHFLAAGCLFTWAIAGPDSVPHRPRFQVRLAVLLVGMAGHAFLSKFLYAHLLPADVPHAAEEIRAAAKLMYYGGDFAEVLLAIALFAGWFGHAGRPGRNARPGLISWARAGNRSPIASPAPEVLP